MGDGLVDAISDTYEGFGDPYDWAVYTLQCEPPPSRDAVEERLGRVPHWFDDARRADVRFYIGYTGSIRERIRRHEEGEGATFTKICKPFKLIDVVWFPEQRQAISIEERREYDLRMAMLSKYGVENINGSPDIYVYQQ